MTAPPDAEVASRLQAILSSEPFHKHVSDYLRELLERWLPRGLHWLRHLSPAQRWALFTVCAILLAAVVVQLALGLRQPAEAGPRARRARRSMDVGEEPGDLAARARELAEAGRWREAARALHQAALLELTRQRGIPWRPELADWEWVASLRDVPGLAEFTSVAQRVAYGPEADRAGFAACEALFRGLPA